MTEETGARVMAFFPICAKPPATNSSIPSLGHLALVTDSAAQGPRLRARSKAVRESLPGRVLHDLLERKRPTADRALATGVYNHDPPPAPVLATDHDT